MTQHMCADIKGDWVKSKGTRLSLIAGSGALMLITACTPPLPPDVLAARLERTIICVPGTQEVAIASDYAEAVNAVSIALNGVCPDQQIVQVGPNEAATVRIVEGPPTAAELDAFAAQCGSAALATPVFGTPIVIAFNISGLEGLVLTPEVIAGMLNGSITSWQDPKIVDVNEGFDVPDLPVDVVRLDVPSGAVEAMTAWLAKEAPDAWTQGEISTLTTGEAFPDYASLIGRLTGVPVDDFGEDTFDEDVFSDEDFSDEDFNEDEFALDDGFDDDFDFGEDILVDDDVFIDLDSDVGIDAVEGEGAIAILPAFYANNNVIPIADLPAANSIITITNVDLAKVGIAAMEITVDEQERMIASHAVGGIPVEGQFDIASAKVILEEGQEEVGWPVIAMSSILVCDEPNDPLPLSTGQFFLRLGGQGAFDSVGLTPLPEPIRVNTLPAMKVELDSAEDADVESEAEGRLNETTPEAPADPGAE